MQQYPLFIALPARTVIRSENQNPDTRGSRSNYYAPLRDYSEHPAGLYAKYARLPRGFPFALGWYALVIA